MDILSEILDQLHFNSSFYYKTSFAEKWGVTMPSVDNLARFHIVTDGEFSYDIPSLKLKGSAITGDILIIFNGLEHNMRGKDSKRVEKSIDFYSKSNHVGHILERGNQTKSPTRVVCGHFSFKEGEDHPLIKSLPSFIHIKESENPHSDSLKTILSLIDLETDNQTAGSLALISRLTEVVFIQALRIFIRNSESKVGFLQLTQDPQLSKAVSAIHKSYAERWTLESLATEAGMSRTAFSKRFRELSKMTPLDYVTYYRLEKGKKMLSDTNLAIAEISELIGYSSNEYFQKLFKKSFRVTPSMYRKNYC